MTILNQIDSAHLAPIKFTKYAQIDGVAYELFGRTVEGPARSRVMKVAKAAHATRAEQMNAITLALQEELAVVVDETPADRNIVDFQREMNSQLLISVGAPVPYLEERRPGWSSRKHDRRTDQVGENVSSVSEMSWRSGPISMPLTASYYGLWCDDGHFETAKIMADVRQDVLAAEPQIAFERHGFKQVDGDAREVTGVDCYTLSLQEAANLARGLLLLIDLATGADDSTGGA